MLPPSHPATELPSGPATPRPIHQAAQLHGHPATQQRSHQSTQPLLVAQPPCNQPASHRPPSHTDTQPPSLQANQPPSVLLTKPPSYPAKQLASNTATQPHTHPALSCHPTANGHQSRATKGPHKCLPCASKSPHVRPMNNPRDSPSPQQWPEDPPKTSKRLPKVHEGSPKMRAAEISISSAFPPGITRGRPFTPGKPPGFHPPDLRIR